MLILPKNKYLTAKLSPVRNHLSSIHSAYNDNLSSTDRN